MSATDPKPEEPIGRADLASAEEVEDFLTKLGTTGELKLELFRKSPQMHKGVQVSGHVKNYDGPFTIDQVALEHGGGKFQVRVQRRGAGTKGWQYSGARTFEVAGLPKIENLVGVEIDPSQKGGNGAEQSPVVAQALNMAHNLIEDSRAQARDAIESAKSNTGGIDDATKLVIDGLQRQVEKLADAVSAKDEKILELVGKEPDNSRENKLFDIMRDGNSDHANRIREMIASHDTELRQLRDYHRDELGRRESRFEKELDHVRAAHQREIDSLKDSHKTAMESQKNAYEMRVDTLKDQKKALERELSELKSEIGTLRAKKDIGPMDMVDTVVKLRNGMESVFPTGGDEEPSKIEKILGTVMESPIIQSIAGRIDSGPPPDGAGDQMVRVRDAEGNIHTVPQSYVDQMRAQQAAQGGGEQGARQGPPIDPAEMQKAIGFLESAYANGTAPQMVAMSAKNLVPASILQYLSRVGVDQFLDSVGLQDNSPLSSVAGRLWVRQLAQVLLQGYVDPEAAADTPAEGPAEAPEGAEEDLGFDTEGALDDTEDPAVQ